MKISLVFIYSSVFAFYGGSLTGWNGFKTLKGNPKFDKLMTDYKPIRDDKMAIPRNLTTPDLKQARKELRTALKDGKIKPIKLLDDATGNQQVDAAYTKFKTAQTALASTNPGYKKYLDHFDSKKATIKADLTDLAADSEAGKKFVGRFTHQLFFKGSYHGHHSKGRRGRHNRHHTAYNDGSYSSNIVSAAHYNYQTGILSLAVGALFLVL